MSAPTLTRPTAPPRPADPNVGLPANALGKEKGVTEQIVLYVFVVVPFLALAAIVPAVWGWGLSWLDVGLAVGCYVFTLLGVTVGYHRYFTHGSFKAKRAAAARARRDRSLAIEGPVVQWVANHRRHHAFSDREGDPHSPWRYGNNAVALVKGLFHAHVGWMFDRELSNGRALRPGPAEGQGPDRHRPAVRLLGLPISPCRPLVGGLVTRSWHGRVVGVLLGRRRPGRAAAPRDVVGQLGLPRRRHRPVLPGRDRATNFWPLAILSVGESGTTCTTPTRPAPGTACSAARSTPPRASSGCSSGCAGPTTCKSPDPVRLAAKRRLPEPATV